MNAAINVTLFTEETESGQIPIQNALNYVGMQTTIKGTLSLLIYIDSFQNTSSVKILDSVAIEIKKMGNYEFKLKPYINLLTTTEFIIQVPNELSIDTTCQIQEYGTCEEDQGNSLIKIQGLLEEYIYI